MVRKHILVANWKMNPVDGATARSLLVSVKRGASAVKGVEVVVCPPDAFLSEFAKLDLGKVRLGSQDAFWAPSGAFTGETSPLLLRSLGVLFVILGHSERRALGESDGDVSKKVNAVLRSEMTPVVCVGERERDHRGEYLGVLRKQIVESLGSVSRKQIGKVIIAYEPIWAIGKTADDAITPDKLHQMTIFIKKVITERFLIPQGDMPAIIYGGSVEPKNALEILRDGNVSGFLVGHASLKAKDFIAIMHAADSVKKR